MTWGLTSSCRSHPQGLGSADSSTITYQIQRLESALANLIGIKPAYVRPPYLDTGGNFMSTISSLGYTAVTDDFDTQDWNGASPSQSEQYFQNAGAYGNGHIPLMHEVSILDGDSGWRGRC